MFALALISVSSLTLPVRAIAATAFVFGGDGTENDDPTGTLHSAARAAREAGFQAVIVTEGLPEDVLHRADVWIQPGGPNFTQAYHMQRTGLFQQVKEFVRRGGGFVGFCGGGFMGQSYGSLGLGLLPGMATKQRMYTQKAEVLWNGRSRFLHFEAGPRFQPGPGIEVFATYAWDGAPAAIRGRYGAGKVVLSGPHPEAQSDWEPAEDPDGLDLDLAIEMIRSAARE